MIPGNKLGLNFLTFVLQLRKTLEKLALRRIEPESGDLEETTLALGHSGIF